MKALLHKKSLMLPIALIGGAVFHQWMGYVTFLSPYLIFVMLFITYCKLRLSDLRLGKFEWGLLILQLCLSAAVYALTAPFNHVVGEGIFICIFVPTATAAPVITSMLGGSISRVATYSLLCNLVIAVIGPIVLAAIGDNADMTFIQSFLLILRQVAPLLILPLLLALLFRRLLPRLHSYVVQRQQLSFYLWAISLFIIVGSCVSFAIKNWTPQNNISMILLCIGALAACIIQFYIGRRYGAAFQDPVAGGQSLMQKNTVLAVWLALAYMNPIASVAPAAYIAWQNIINSWQLINRDRFGNKSSDDDAQK
ncbi:MAG: transporter [Muribaculaceae bacterium]|nr:transporter [Muribaculaceae bacterium]